MREPHEFTVGGRRYRAEPMDAISQRHVARRVQPLLVAALPAIMEVFAAERASRASADNAEGAVNSVEPVKPASFNVRDFLEMDRSKFMPALMSTSTMLADMSDEAYDYIQAKCLSRVHREKPGDTGWAAIWNTQAGRMLFDDIEGHEVETIVMTVLTTELGPFFFGLVSNFVEASPA